MTTKKSVRIEDQVDKDLNLMMEELNINYSQALNLALNSFFAQQNKDEKYIKTILKSLVKSLDK